jgi:hypothetical protein
MSVTQGTASNLITRAQNERFDEKVSTLCQAQNVLMIGIGKMEALLDAGHLPTVAARARQYLRELLSLHVDAGAQHMLAAVFQMRSRHTTVEAQGSGQPDPALAERAAYDEIKQLYASQQRIRQRAVEVCTIAPTQGAVSKRVQDQVFAMCDAALVLEKNNHDRAFKVRFGPAAAEYLRIASEANAHRSEALDELPPHTVAKLRLSSRMHGWTTSVRLSVVYKDLATTGVARLTSRLEEFARSPNEPGNTLLSQELGEELTKVMTMQDTALKHHNATDDLRDRLWEDCKDLLGTDGWPESVSEQTFNRMKMWVRDDRMADAVAVNKIILRFYFVYSHLIRNAQEGTSDRYRILSATATHFHSQLDWVFGNWNTLGTAMRAGTMSSTDVARVFDVLLDRLQRLLLIADNADANAARLGHSFAVASLPEGFGAFRPVVADMIAHLEERKPKLDPSDLAPAADSSTRLIDTKYDGVLVGEQHGDRIVVATSHSTTTFIQQAGGAWEEEAQDETDAIGAVAPISSDDASASVGDTARRAAIAKARSGLTRLQKELTQGLTKADADRNTARQIGNDSDAQFVHFSGLMESAMSGLGKLVQKIHRTLPFMEVLAETPEAPEVQALTGSLQQLKHQIDSMAQEIINAAKTLPCTRRKFECLLAKNQVYGVTTSKHREQLKGTSDPRLPTVERLDFMDEHLVDIKEMSAPIVVHSHYRSATARLDQCQACHIKFDGPDGPVRIKIGLQTLQQLCAWKPRPTLMAGPQQASTTSTTPAHKGKRRRKKFGGAAVAR